jgi:hypothetical protein
VGSPVGTLTHVPVDIEPPELARLVDFAERPRADDWSLRAALVRYAQPQPQRVNDLLDVMRRTEWALGKQRATLERDGAHVWEALAHGGATADDAQLLGLLRIAREIDALGDVLAEWAIDITRDRPDAEVDRVIDDGAQQLDVLGVPEQERPPGPRNRGV